MIGGTDIVIQRSADVAARRAVMTALQRAWPEAWIEDACSAASHALLTSVEPGSLPSEFFVYKTATSRDSWENEGATDENADTMIHVFLGPETLTLVVDERPASETRRIADVLRWWATTDELIAQFDEPSADYASGKL